MVSKEPVVFFGANTIDLAKWKVKKLEGAARGLLSNRPRLYAFINADDVTADRFIVTLGRKPGEAALTYEATIVDEDTNPYLKCLSKIRNHES